MSSSLLNIPKMHPDPDVLLKLVRATMPFGKFKGQKIVRLPVFYLEWLARDGFKNDTLGQYLSTMYEIKINGIEKILEPYIRQAAAEERGKSASPSW